MKKILFDNTHNKEEMKYMKWGNWFAIIISFLVFSCFLVVNIYSNYPIWFFKTSVKEPLKTSGFVKNIIINESTSSEGTSTQLIYTEYTVRGTTVTNIREIGWQSGFRKQRAIRLNDVVEVLYDPASPERAIVNDDAFKNGEALTFIIISGIGILLCLAASVYKLFRDRRAKKYNYGIKCL
jgi:hypothetical protein